MFLLGRQLPDGQKVSVALTVFTGISYSLAARLCARLQLHETAKVRELTDGQVTRISAYLSSPDSIPMHEKSITRGPLIGSAREETTSTSSSSSPQTSGSSSSSSNNTSALAPSQRPSPSKDPLRSLLLESDLRRFVQANIAHHRDVGSYKGKRHQQGLPVRGQRTSSNAQTAKKLNRIDRRTFATFTSGQSAESTPSTSVTQRPTVSSLFSPLKVPTRF